VFLRMDCLCSFADLVVDKERRRAAERKLTGVSRRLPSSSILKYCVKKRCQGIGIANDESISDSSQPCGLEHQLVGCVGKRTVWLLAQ